MLQNYTYPTKQIWRLINVHKFTYELIEDSTILDDNISEAILNYVKKCQNVTSQIGMIHPYLDLMPLAATQNTERVLYSDKICYMNRYIPNSNRPSQLYLWLSTRYMFPDPISVSCQPKQISTSSNLPCTIFMKWVRGNDLK